MLISLVSFIIFAALIWSLPLFSDLDAEVAGLLLRMKSCSLQIFLEQTQHLGYGLAAFFFGCSLVSSRGRIGRGEIWSALTSLGTGAIMVQFLKTFIERERPSMIPGIAIGHSMPSGDITNGAIAIGAAIWLARRRGSNFIATGYLLAGALFVTVVFLRLAPLRHWLTDAVASGLLAVSCLSFSLNGFSRRHWFAPIVSAGVLGLGLLLVTFVPGIRLHLSSALDSQADPVATWHAAAGEEADNLGGNWSEESVYGRLPSLALQGGEGELFVSLPRQQRYALFLGLQPDARESETRVCHRLEVTINNQQVDDFVLSGGWRQYQVEIPRRLARKGRNRIGLRLLSVGATSELKLSYLAIYSR